MQITVKIEGGLSSEPIPLVLSIFYENEVRVEEREQNILHVLTKTPSDLCINPGSTTCSFKIRIEKVSRRKDGQRFKVRCDADTEKMKSSGGFIEGCFTTPITVLSKRKHLMAANAAASGGAGSKRKERSKDHGDSDTGSDGGMGAAGPVLKHHRSRVGGGANDVEIYPGSDDHVGVVNNSVIDRSNNDNG